MKKLLYCISILLSLTLFINISFAQELAPLQNKTTNEMDNMFLPKTQMQTGDILYSIQLINDRDPLGVTIINSIIYITSSDGAGSNYWDTYSLDGTYLTSVVQGTNSSYGYRDLAFDGTNILASDDNDIDKIDPSTFAIVSTITNAEHSPHRGLAYDPNENAIYSTNWTTGPCIKIDASNGALIKELNQPSSAPYGIAFDNFTYSNYASLWYAEPTVYGVFRLSRADTTFGNINFSFDLSAELPDSSLSGGLEIINNHPNYPDKVIAVAVEQNSRQLIFVDISNAPEILPGSLEEVSEFGGFDANGVITYGMVQYSDYLYAINNGDLSIYEIASNPETPNFVKTITVGDGNRIFLHNSLLYITSGNPSPDSFSIYDISDPLNPVFNSTVDTGFPILDMEFEGNYAFLIQSGIAQMTVYDATDISNSLQYLVYNLLSPATDLAININRGILFVSMASGGVPNNRIELIDISDMNTVQQLDIIPTSVSQPKSIVPIDDNYLAVMRNNIDNDNCIINIYDYSDKTDINFVDLHYLSWNNGGWDMFLLEDILVVTIPDEGIHTLSWSETTQTFLFGPILEQPEPLKLTQYIPPAGSIANIKSGNKNITITSDLLYLYETNGLGLKNYTIGSLPNKVIKVLKPGRKLPTDKVNLTMKVSPPEAAANGCTTIPAPGVSEYNLNSQINVYAVPNPTLGWYFTGWTGDVSGTNLIAPLLMDGDKVANAYFDKLELTVSGSIDKDIYCPTKINENPRLLELPFLVCASDADGWNLSKISFRASGTGNDALHIKEVNLYKTGKSVYSGFYGVDNGTIDVTFSPPISIGPGQCVPFKLTYDLEFEPEFYALDETQSFHIETFGVSAVPWTLEGGDILGKAKNDSLIFARVTNNDGYYFSKINDAVNATTTGSGDTCLVCPGTYTENIQLMDTTKALTIKSIEGAEETIVKPSLVWDWIFLFHGQAYKIIDGFTFLGSSVGNLESKGISMSRTIVGEVINSTFTNLTTGISFNKTSFSKIEENTFLNCGIGVSLTRANNNEVYNNEFHDFSPESPTIDLFRADRNYIHYNRIYGTSADNTSMWINLKESSHNKIRTHYARVNSSQKRLIKLEKKSIANEIFENENFILEIVGQSDSNNIYDNKLKKIKLISSNTSTNIENNKISNSDDYGIYIYDDYFTKGIVYIKYNSIFNNTKEGIKSSGVSTNILYNNIYNNGTGSEKRSGINFSSIYVNGLIYNNDIYNNGEHGVIIYECRDISVSQNNITGHNNGTPNAGTTAGVSIYGLGSGERGSNYVNNNYIAENCTGINVLNGDNVIIKENTIENSFCWNTGIHLNNSSASISGNSIINNNGNGISFENNSEPEIINNNIFGNSDYGLNNGNSEGSINADGNYWGNSNGPGGNGIFGNVHISNWLTEQVSIVVSPERDTLFALSGTTDSTAISMQNLAILNDRLILTISDDKGWVSPIDNQEINLTDSTGGSFQLQYSIPGDVAEGEMATVNYSVLSTTDSTKVSGSFYISLYLPMAHKIEIPLTMQFVDLGDTLQFVAYTYDQFGNQLDASVDWSTTSGSINSSGLFIAPNSSSEVEITATNSDVGISAKSVIFVTEEVETLSGITVSPDSVEIDLFGSVQFSANGINQFGYTMSFEPIWSSSGGYIEDNGFYSADSISGVFYVMASDTSGTLLDSAVVVVRQPTGVAEKIIPLEFTLFQNYPNPFNPSTTINFGLKEEGYVTLSIFNILGERVALPVNKNMKAGIHNVNVNFGSLASGIYIYRIDVKGKFTDVKKMILLR